MRMGALARQQRKRREEKRERESEREHPPLSVCCPSLPPRLLDAYGSSLHALPLYMHAAVALIPLPSSAPFVTLPPLVTNSLHGAESQKQLQLGAATSSTTRHHRPVLVRGKCSSSDALLFKLLTRANRQKEAVKKAYAAKECCERQTSCRSVVAHSRSAGTIHSQSNETRHKCINS